MWITLQQLERNPVRFSVSVRPDDIEFATELTQISALTAEGSAVLINHAVGEIRVQGRVDVEMSVACDRCLEAVRLPVRSDFDLVYLPADESGGGEHEVEQAAIEVGFYEGSGLELNDILREVVLLALPMQVVCDQACKGICPVCGQNRNGASCDCQTGTTDDRWSKLKDFRPRTA